MDEYGDPWGFGSLGEAVFNCGCLVLGVFGGIIILILFTSEFM